MTEKDNQNSGAQTIDFVRPLPANDHAPGQQLSTTSKSRTKRRAFILEDVEANARMVAGFLDQTGYDDIRWVNTIAACQPHMDFLKSGHFDLVLLDIMLSDGVAFDMLKELAQSGTRSWICAFTARSRKDELKQLIEAGCDRVFLKPLRYAEFQAGLDTLANQVSRPQD